MKTKNTLLSNLKGLLSEPSIQALAQVDPLSSGIATYISGQHTKDQVEGIRDYIHLLHSRVQVIEREKIDRKFFDSRDGKRLVSRILSSVLRDRREEKIRAMSNLTVNLFLKSKINVDQKEVYVDILDNLHVLQLSILERAVLEVRGKGNGQRSFGWEKLAKEYEGKGVSGALLLQSLRALESNGLVNQNTATMQEENSTHFITIFGEEFYAFVSDPENLDEK